MTLCKADLHDYQKYSADFIVTHPVAALLLSCGLGKTVTTLTAIDELLFDRFEAHRVLVVCPLRVGNVWKDEVQKWTHLKNLVLSVAIGTEQQRIDALNARADIYIINRENVQWLVANTRFDFDMIVIDELTLFERDVIVRSVIVVIIHYRYLISEFVFYAVCECRFAGAGPAGNADYKAVHQFDPP